MGKIQRITYPLLTRIVGASPFTPPVTTLFDRSCRHRRTCTQFTPMQVVPPFFKTPSSFFHSFFLADRDILDEALVFHLIPERRPLLQSFRTIPRACEVRGHIYVVGGLNRHGKKIYSKSKSRRFICWFFQGIL